MTGQLTGKFMDRLEAGCNATTFHQKCDNQGPTVTVLYNQQGSIYGGYASSSWNSAGAYIQDGTAFLFQLNAKDAVLHCAHEHPNEKVEPGESLQSPGRAPVNRHYAGTHRGYTGIRPRQSCGNAPHRFIPMPDHALGLRRHHMGYITMGNGYSNQGVTADLVNNGTMAVAELEVYRNASTEGREPITSRSLGEHHIRYATATSYTLLEYRKA
ncbi:hypothetical protein DPMN_118994 [Dreissena polymorpha]|uniref:TLDc domain-containing protein n=1 Tax=Dreissena polymorpha TaxID=45954 RepID=A0A9D4JQU0_DREPO|nr:hypothetical protein DPMN_118994 [Dreissena polymorpha]